jgi:hypothetical protein
LVLADTRRAREQAAELGELGERSGLAMARWGAAAMDTTFALTEGRFDLFPALNERERELGAAVGYAGPLSADAHMMVAAMLREDSVEYARMCRSMLEAYAQSVAGTGVSVMVAWAVGDASVARAELAAWCRDHRPYVPAEFLFTSAATLARAAADLAMPDEVRVLHDLLEPHAGTWCTIGTGPDFGMTEHSLALLTAALGDADRAAAYLRSAIDVYRREGARAWLAVGLADLAALSADPGEKSAASAEACSLAATIGAEGVVRRARAALGVA